MNKLISCFILGMATLSGCATSNRNLGTNNNDIVVDSAVVIAVRNFNEQTTQLNKTGLLVGGVAGGVLGNQIGKGNGKKIATVAGALIGAGVGSNVNQNTTYSAMVELTVQESHGNLLKVTQPRNYDYFVGQYVFIKKQGNKAQINPQ